MVEIQNNMNILLLGGCGWIGRNMVKELQEKAIGNITVVDKRPPIVLNFTPEYADIFHTITFIQADLSKQERVASIFTQGNFDIVVNMAGNSDSEGIQSHLERDNVEVSKVCSEQAVIHKCRLFIEISTAEVYKPSKKGNAENSKVKPWTRIAKLRCIAEQNLIQLYTGMEPEMKYVILRLPEVYGSGTTGLMSRVCACYVMKKIDKSLRWPWSKELAMNTVHIKDVCAAIIFLSLNSEKLSSNIYNIADYTNTNQGILAELLVGIFGIKIKFIGNFKSSLSSLMIDSILKTTNEGMLTEWHKILYLQLIKTTPLSPLLKKDNYKNKGISLKQKLLTDLGFKYEYPQLTEELLLEAIQYFIINKMLPTLE